MMLVNKDYHKLAYRTTNGYSMLVERAQLNVCLSPGLL